MDLSIQDMLMIIGKQTVTIAVLEAKLAELTEAHNSKERDDKEVKNG